jgi:hypothetical protein
MEEESLFVDKMPIEMPIATNDSENRRNEEGELDDSVYVGRAAAGDKTLKDAQIFEGAASRQISDNENSPVDGITSVPACRNAPRNDTKRRYFKFKRLKICELVKISVHFYFSALYTSFEHS